MPTETVEQAFGRIIKKIHGHRRAKAILPSFLKPAADQDITAFEKRAKLKLPAALASLYKIHNGQDEEIPNDLAEDGPIESGLFPSIESGDLPFLLAPLDQLAENLGRQMPGFRAGWIPFGDNFGGDHIVLDQAENTPDEKKGRVLQFNHEYGCAVELAPSFEKYLSQLANDLEGGRIIWDADAGLTYKKSRSWDDLIEQKKVEYQEEPDSK